MNTESEVYYDRPKSKFVTNIIDNYANMSRKDIADVIGISYGYFCNKCNRNSFSFEDILLILDACGIEIRLVTKKTNLLVDELDVKDFLSKEIIAKERYVAHQKYTKLQDEIRRIKEQYNFEEEDHCEE